MKETPSTSRGCLIGVVIVLLAFGLMLSTRGAQRHSDHFSCYGQLGEGLPVSFLCDYSGGGSPISSAGKIDSADFPYFSPQGTFVDLLFYSMHLGMIWYIASVISRKDLIRREKFRRAGWVLLLYLIGFLSALIVFQPFDLQIKRNFPRTPTPLVSPTTMEVYPPVTPSP